MDGLSELRTTSWTLTQVGFEGCGYLLHWLLALDFIFTLCVSPCPGILILDVVQMRSLLDASHTGAFDFSRLCLYQHWSWGQEGSSLNLIQALESIVILETHECTSLVMVWATPQGSATFFRGNSLKFLKNPLNSLSFQKTPFKFKKH